MTENSSKVKEAVKLVLETLSSIDKKEIEDLLRKQRLKNCDDDYGCYFMIDQNGGKPWSDCVVDSGEEECDYQVANAIECAEDCKYWRKRV